MDELCPLCLKIGTKTKIKAVQVNLSEAVWMCENEECPWPFGYEKPNIFTRKIGEKWSFEWQVYKKLEKRIGPIPVSTELSLYTPPVTPSSDGVAKDSTKTDLSDGTSTVVSIGNNDVSKGTSVPGDSYAPRFIENGVWLPNECPRIAKENSTITDIAISKISHDSEMATQGSSVISSIFDIDAGDDLFKNKIGIASPSSNTQSTNSPECTTTKIGVLDVKNRESVDNRVDAVLNTKSETSVEKSLENKNIVITSVNTEPAKLPFVRSIARTKINLQRFVSSSNVGKFDKIKKTETPIDASSVTPPSDLDDRTNHKQQHTTTIKVEGIPPITLSYDLADLGVKSETVPLTSTPLQKKIKRDSATLQNNLNDESLEITTELPKKQTKISINRRTAKGKQYEKFSFSALRKNVQETKESNNEKLCLSVNEATTAENELARVKQITNIKKEDLSSTKTCLESNKCTAIDTIVKQTPITTSCSIETNNPRKSDESLISVKQEPNNSLANDSKSDESMNLSILDDMLLDGYQNATKNLNDDWLESFFV